MAVIIGIEQSENLIGTIYNDNIQGNGGDDTLIGNSGNDTLDGGTGNDSLKGGSGNDIYIVDSTADIVSEDNGNGGNAGGYDTVKSSVDWTLGDYLENLTLTGTAAINGNGNALNNFITGNSASNYLFGGDGNDSIKGEAGDDTIYGGLGNDKIGGGSGNDYFEDGAGDNTLCGGAGDDTFYEQVFLYDTSTGTYLTTPQTQTIDGGTGNDFLYIVFLAINAGIVTTLDSNTKGTITAGSYKINFQNIERFEIYGTEYSDILLGGNGNDILSGGDGDDTIRGGAGDDTLSAGSGNSLLDGGNGNDLLNSSGTSTLIGGTGDDTLNSSGYSKNLLDGGNGNDSLSITTDYDYYPESGSNTLKGGNGDDSFSVLFYDYKSSASSSYPTSLATHTIDGGSGNDFLFLAYYYNAPQGIITTLDATTGAGSITGGDFQINFQSIEAFQLQATPYSDSLLGGNSNDSLFGGNGGNDTLIGGAGDDFLFKEGSGQNLLDGGDGNDSFRISPGSTYPTSLVTQTVNGGTGKDYLNISFNSTSDGIVTILDATNTNGTISSGNYQVNFESIESLQIYGTSYSDILLGVTGNDTLYGQFGDDTINGGAGDDYLSASGSGSNLLYGGDGNDLLELSTPYSNPTSLTTQIVDGGTGNDSLSASYSYVSAGIVTALDSTTTNGTITAGNYQISFESIEALFIVGTSYSDSLLGGNGNDDLYSGSKGNDTLNGGAGDDTLSTYAIDNDLLYGGDGNDLIDIYIPDINPTSLVTQIVDGGTGNDSLSANYSYALEGIVTTLDSTTTNGTITAGNYQISFESIEHFQIDGTSYSDSLLGGNGNDSLSGGYGGGNDTLKGGAGDDTLVAQYSSGDSLLDGGDGNDILTGGDGVDTFAYSNYSEGVDTIFNFNSSQDLIQILASGFSGGLTAGSLSQSQFVIGTAATTSAQRFIYDNATGALYFDQDGSGGGFIQQQLAQITGGISLTVSNFVVV